jgi:hypothetical protein
MEVMGEPLSRSLASAPVEEEERLPSFLSSSAPPKSQRN